MALSGSYSQKMTNKNYTMRFDWTASQDFSAGDTTISYKIYMIGTSAAFSGKVGGFFGATELYYTQNSTSKSFAEKTISVAKGATLQVFSSSFKISQKEGPGEFSFLCELWTTNSSGDYLYDGYVSKESVKLTEMNRIGTVIFDSNLMSMKLFGTNTVNYTVPTKVSGIEYQIVLNASYQKTKTSKWVEVKIKTFAIDKTKTTAQFSFTDSEIEKLFDMMNMYSGTLEVIIQTKVNGSAVSYLTSFVGSIPTFPYLDNITLLTNQGFSTSFYESYLGFQENMDFEVYGSYLDQLYLSIEAYVGTKKISEFNYDRQKGVVSGTNNTVMNYYGYRGYWTFTGSPYNSLGIYCPTTTTADINFVTKVSFFNSSAAKYIDVYEKKETLKGLEFATSRPSISGSFASYLDTNTTTSGKTGNNQYIVQGLSVMKLTVDKTKLTSSLGATITEITVDAGGTSYKVPKPETSGQVATSSYDNKEVLTIDTKNIKEVSNGVITFKDSRGLSNTYTFKINGVPYSPPSFNLVAERKAGYLPSTLMNITDGRISTVLINGVNKNSLSSTDATKVKFEFFNKNGEAVTSVSVPSSILALNMSYNSKDGKFLTSDKISVELDNGNQFTIRLTVTDAFGGYTSKEVLIKEGKSILRLNKALDKVLANKFNAQHLEALNRITIAANLEAAEDYADASSTSYMSFVTTGDYAYVQTDKPVVFTELNRALGSGTSYLKDIHIGKLNSQSASVAGDITASGLINSNNIPIIMKNGSNITNGNNQVRIQMGRASVGGLSGYNVLKVTFPTAFSTTPQIFVSMITAVAGTTITGVSTDAVTTSDFDIRVYRSSTTNTAVDWIAFGY